MKAAACALPAVLLLCSCLGKLLPRQPATDPDNAQITLNKSGDPFAPTTASLKLPGLASSSTPAEGGFAGTAPASGEGAAPGSLFDFSSAFQNPAQSRLAHWRRSGADAIQEARRTSLPLLILFTHESIDPAKEMEAALSNTPELASDTPRFIPLRLDFSDKTTADSDFYRSFQDRYKPRGYPVLILALPDGTELTRQTGCTKDMRTNINHWLDDAASRARSGLDLHRHKLESKKYRLWKNKDGHEIFARLESQDANQLTFTSEWGDPIHTFTNRLSQPDQALIESKQF
jgi:hypothetical protein